MGTESPDLSVNGPIISAISTYLCEVIYTFEPNLKYWLYSICNISLKCNYQTLLTCSSGEWFSSHLLGKKRMLFHTTTQWSLHNDTELHFLLLIRHLLCWIHFFSSPEGFQSWFKCLEFSFQGCSFWSLFVMPAKALWKSSCVPHAFSKLKENPHFREGTEPITRKWVTMKWPV